MQGAAPGLAEKLTDLRHFLMRPPPPSVAGRLCACHPCTAFSGIRRFLSVTLALIWSLRPAETVSVLLFWPPHSTTSLLLFWSETEMIPLSSRNSPHPHFLVQGGKLARSSLAHQAGPDWEKALSSHITGSRTPECQDSRHF